MKNRDVVQRPPAFRLKLQLRSKPFCFIVPGRGTCLYDTSTQRGNRVNEAQPQQQQQGILKH